MQPANHSLYIEGYYSAASSLTYLGPDHYCNPNWYCTSVQYWLHEYHARIKPAAYNTGFTQYLLAITALHKLVNKAKALCPPYL